ncbi:hypothetical protein EV197_2465 [Aquimarina brevivitae]|uniref:Uncharacterized protein n=2 Tax=Aquimarina brevivitae TaxID=323412 RepID=A0A4Q7P2A7_9FLAO|nr:hypothetical protein EV197_2465 [Aquimarina brevivitae]
MSDEKNLQFLWFYRKLLKSQTQINTLMQISTLSQKFNKKNLEKKYKDLWNKGIHLKTVDDRNRDFYYSIFYVNFLFVEVIYNKITGEIITIKSFTDINKLMYYLNEDFQ